MTYKNLKQNTLFFCITVMFYILVFMPYSSAHAAFFEFATSSVSRAAQIGDTILIPVFVEGSDGNISIAGADMDFPKELLWAKSFELSEEWLQVSEDKYNFIDNNNGILRKTAGIAEKVDEKILFGTIEFIAIWSGIAEIRLEKNSFILDGANNDILEKKAGSVQVVIEKYPIDSKLPPQLFDISLLLVSDEINAEESIIAHVTFESFGSVQTPVDMVFSITDENGQVFMSTSEHVVVETEILFTKSFSNLNLPAGDYVLHMRTTYSGNIKDDFNTPFKVTSRASPWQWLKVLAGIFFIAGAIALFRRFWRK